MLPNRIPESTMNDVMDTNDNGTERTSEPHIVVACPSCCTKFAIESSLVASYEVPRFHCSRCDAIFELQQQQAVPQPNTPSQRWVLDDTPQKAPRNDDTSRSPASTTSKPPLKSTDFTLGALPDPDTFEQRPQFEPVEKSAGLSILGFRPSASRRHSSSLTRNEAQSIAGATVASPQQQQSLSEPNDPFALFDSPAAPAAVDTAATPQTSDTQLTGRVQLDQQPPLATTSSAVASRQPLKSAVQNNAREVAAISSQVNDVSGDRAALGRDHLSFLSRLSDKTQSLVRLSIPVLATMGILAGFSIATRFMPLTMDSVFGAVVPGFIAGRASHLPPPELSVQDLNLSLEKTQSKETLPVIRGFVNNASDSTFEDVSIEALGFNARGELLVRARAPLRSALSREKISDLPLETVKKFQNALSASDASIKGGEKVAFSVALFLQDAAPQEVTYFSARVFSVGRKR
jgi:hypothetical protein